MYRSFSIKNFRCFDELNVEGLGRINLIAGKNTVGKTALLEALWVHGTAVRPEFVLRLDRQRGSRRSDLTSTIDNLFFGFDHDLVIKLSARGDWGNNSRLLHVYAQEQTRVELSLESEYDEQPEVDPSILRHRIVMDYFDEANGKTTSSAWPAEQENNTGFWSIESQIETENRPSLPSVVFLRTDRQSGSADARTYSRLEIAGRQERVLKILQEIEPRLKRIAVVSTGPLPAIYVDIGLERLVPVQLLGEGMSRILALALAISRAPGGTVLVDEIENGIHHSVMEKVLRAIGTFARSYDVQIFATTHSRECVYYAHKAFEADEEEEMRFFRIDGAYGKLRAVMYDKEMREAAFVAGFGIR